MQLIQQAMFSIYLDSRHKLSKIKKITRFIIIMRVFLMTTPSVLLNLLEKMLPNRLNTLSLLRRHGKTVNPYSKNSLKKSIPN